jgi:hypothetical protein
MLIISKHHDYYDGLSKQYLDKTIVYDREEQEIQNSKIGYGTELSKLLVIYKDIPRTGGYYSKLKQYNNFMEPILVGFCGEFYLIYHCSLVSDQKECYLHTQLETLDKYQELKYDFQNRYIYGFDDKRIKNAFLEVGKMKGDDIFIEMDCPVFLIRKNIYSNINRFVITKNPVLQDIGFQRIKDPFKCFQDIQTYLSSILVKKEEIIKISDNDLLHSKGYDKFSFRKEKKI